ncbi:recombinase family protein [Halobacillus seohaensis]
MIKYLREGDTVVVYKLDRIGRSTKHLVDLI